MSMEYVCSCDHGRHDACRYLVYNDAGGLQCCCGKDLD